MPTARPIRNKSLHVLLSKDEFEALRLAADARGISMADVVREHVHTLAAGQADSKTRTKNR